MTKKIVRIQKLNDIDKDDWKITFDDGVYITKTHEQFFELVERGLYVVTSREIKMSERPKAEETSAIFETDREVRINEKKKVNEFREDVRNLSYYQFNKKYVNKGDTKKWYMNKNSSTLASFELKLTTEGLIVLEKKIAPANEFTEAMDKWNPSYENTPVIESMIKYSDEVFTVMLQDIQKMTY